SGLLRAAACTTPFPDAARYNPTRIPEIARTGSARALPPSTARARTTFKDALTATDGPTPPASGRPAVAPPSITAAVTALLSADPGLTADEVIQRAKARGVKAPDASIRHVVHNVRSKVRKGTAKPAPAAARQAPAPKPKPAPAGKTSTPSTPPSSAPADVS